VKGIKAMNKQTRKDEPATKPAHDKVAKVAYAISQEEGRPQGSAEKNWLEAEARLQHPGSAHAEHREHNEHQGHQNHHAHMAADFRKRFWISLVLTLPILVLSPMLQTLVGAREAIGFPATPMFCLAFLRRFSGTAAGRSSRGWSRN
jgi:cation transport ATPase